MTSTLALLVFLSVVVAAIVALVLLRSRGAGGGTADAGGREGAGATGRSPVESALAWSVGIGGGLILARALLELAEGLAQLPGASEHWAGDVMLWLILVLPIPIGVGSTGLLAARWLSSHSIGDARAMAVWLSVACIALAWIWLAWTSVTDQGGDVRAFDDPMLWLPGGALIGVICGIVALPAAVLVRGRVSRPTHPRGR